MTGDAIFSVRGKVALVTGAAAGLGRAMAEALAENGAHLTLFDRDAAPLAATARDLRALGAQVLDLAGDVTDAAVWPGVEAMITACGVSPSKGSSPVSAS